MPTEIQPSDSPTRALALQLLDISDGLRDLCSAISQDKHVSNNTREKAAALWHVLGYAIPRIDRTARMKTSIVKSLDGTLKEYRVNGE